MLQCKTIASKKSVAEHSGNEPPERATRGKPAYRSGQHCRTERTAKVASSHARTKERALPKAPFRPEGIEMDPAQRAKHRSLLFSNRRCYCCSGIADDVFGCLPESKWRSNNVHPVCPVCLTDIYSLVHQGNVSPREVCDKLRKLNTFSPPVRDQLMKILLTTDGIQDKV